MFSRQMLVTASLATLMMILFSSVEPTQGVEVLHLCMKNCAQCKKMYGAYFEGNLCARNCFQSEGTFIPDCVDIASIGQFLNKNE